MKIIKKSEMLKNIDLIKNEIVDIYYTPNTVFEGEYFTKYNEYDFNIFVLLNNGNSIIVNTCTYRNTAISIINDIRKYILN